MQRLKAVTRVGIVESKFEEKNSTLNYISENNIENKME